MNDVAEYNCVERGARIAATTRSKSDGARVRPLCAAA